MKRAFLAISLSVVIMSVSGARGAAGEANDDKTLSPYFFIEDGDPSTDRLPLKETRADVRISGVIADVLVTQVYRNEGSRPIHARYMFPASTRAAVHGMTLQVGAQRVRAQIREKEAAHKEFDQAKAAGKSAALLEQQRPNVFSMSVANVMPQDEIHVELHYSELLVPTDGTYEFVYPTVVGPRYSNEPARSAPEDDRWVESPYLHEGQLPTYSFDIHARIAAGMRLQDLVCPSHHTIVEWENLNTAVVRLDPSEAQGGNRDFILRYRLEGTQIETGLLLYPGADEGFFLLLVEPPVRVTPQQIPPREYIFVLDVSGSMYGFPLDTAKVLMRDLVGGLRPVDRFNILFFSGGSWLLASESLPATPENLREAMAAVEQMRGGGGTELAAALQRALDLPAGDGVSRSTIVVTDGYVGAEADVFERIRNNLDRSNLFAFGIGSSVNRYLIEGMAKAGQGEPFIVTSAAESSAAAARFREYVQSPVLTDVEVSSKNFETYDIEPPSIPDLFADRPLVIFGKWRGGATGTLRVRGIGGDGPFEQTFNVADAGASDDNRALRYLWARARVARLSDYGSRNDDASRQEVTNLGLSYELLTPYTSFIAVHEVVRNYDGDARNVDQPLPLPEGVADCAVGRPVPEPELSLLLCLALVLCLLISIRREPPPRRLEGHEGKPLSALEREPVDELAVKEPSQSPGTIL
jgi:Ca-activated chloride channel homolog